MGGDAKRRADKSAAEITRLHGGLAAIHDALHKGDVEGAHDLLHKILQGGDGGDVARRLAVTRSFDEGFRALSDTYGDGMFAYMALVPTGRQGDRVVCSMQTGGHAKLCQILDAALPVVAGRLTGGPK